MEDSSGEDSKVDIVEEAFPQFILFGHELVHAWREINGLFDYNVEQGQIPYDVGQTWPAEEIKTMGINYTDTAGNSMRNYSTYNGIISENGLRLENGLNVRVSYLGWYKNEKINNYIVYSGFLCCIWRLYNFGNQCGCNNI